MKSKFENKFTLYFAVAVVTVVIWNIAIFYAMEHQLVPGGHN